MLRREHQHLRRQRRRRPSQQARRRREEGGRRRRPGHARADRHPGRGPGYNNIEDTQRRFRKLIERYPSRADILEGTFPYYLDSLDIFKNTQGLEAAVAKVEPGVAAAAKQAAEQAAAPGASEEAKKASATLTQLATELRNASRASNYAAAAALIAEKGDAAPRNGKTAPPEFAQARRALREVHKQENKASPDTPNALFDAGIA